MRHDRRDFLARSGKLLLLTGAAQVAFEAVLRGEPESAPNYRTTDHWWAMTIDIEKCIGCGNCVRACKEENDVPREPFYFRTCVRTGNRRSAHLAIGDSHRHPTQFGEIALLDGREDAFMSICRIARGQ